MKGSKGSSIFMKSPVVIVPEMVQFVAGSQMSEPSSRRRLQGEEQGRDSYTLENQHGTMDLGVASAEVCPEPALSN